MTETNNDNISTEIDMVIRKMPLGYALENQGNRLQLPRERIL